MWLSQQITIWQFSYILSVYEFMLKILLLIHKSIRHNRRNSTRNIVMHSRDIICMQYVQLFFRIKKFINLTQDSYRTAWGLRSYSTNLVYALVYTVWRPRGFGCLCLFLNLMKKKTQYILSNTMGRLHLHIFLRLFYLLSTESFAKLCCCCFSKLCTRMSSTFTAR